MKNLPEGVGLYDSEVYLLAAFVAGLMAVLCFFRTLFAALDAMSLRKNDYANQINIFYTNKEFYKKRVEDLCIQSVFFFVFLLIIILAFFLR
jgi:hypothetical protein